MSRQKEKILLTLNCSSLRELLWQGGAPITRNSSCVLFTKGPKAMFVSIETVATFPVFVMKKLLALYVCSHIYCHRNTILLQQRCWCCYECKLLLLWCFLIIITAVLFPLFLISFCCRDCMKITAVWRADKPSQLYYKREINNYCWICITHLKKWIKIVLSDLASITVSDFLSD